MKKLLFTCIVSLISLSTFANGIFTFNQSKFGCIAYFFVHYVDSQGHSLGSFVFSDYGDNCADAMEAARARASYFIETNK